MSFSIELYYNHSEDIKLDKDLEWIMRMTGELRQECSIIDPIILIEADLEAITECNYMVVPMFGRAYFINNIRSIRIGLVEISCHVDVLSSFAAGIRTNSAIVRRQESQWNLYLNDGSFRVYQNSMVLTKAFPAGFTTQEFVLAVAGSASSSANTAELHEVES